MLKNVVLQKKIPLTFALLATIIILSYVYYWYTIALPQSIKVGILHSRTGALAFSEAPVIEATLLAIKEINEAGGLLGKTLEPIITDGKSDPETFATQAEYLISNEKVAIIFGCWTSASRKAVKPIFERHKSLLFYPVQYEGLEQSPNIIYTGAAPSQQIIPGVAWCLKNLGKKIFLVGSDYIFPRCANAIIKEIVPQLGGTIVEEQYILLGSNDVEKIITSIAQVKPEIILNTINGITNVAFFKSLKELQKKGQKFFVMSFSISDAEFPSIGIENIQKSYTCWNYYESINTSENKVFKTKINLTFGAQPISDPMEAAYFGVHLWAKAVRQSQSIEVEKIKKEISKVTFLAPEGMVAIEPKNQHTWKFVRIGRVNNEGQTDIVWQSNKPVHPDPYPSDFFITHLIKKAKTKDDWQTFVKNLYQTWGNKWQA